MRYLLLFFLFGILGCRKEPIPNISVPETRNVPLKVVWQQLLFPDSDSWYSQPIGVVAGGVLYVSSYKNKAAIELRDAESGELRWKFDQFNPSFPALYEPEIVILKNKLVVRHDNDTYCIHLETGTLDWQIENRFANGGPDIACIGEFAYQSCNFNGVTTHNKASLIRTHYLTGLTDTVTSILAQDGFCIYLLSPKLWINPMGDSVLVLRDHQFRFDANGKEHVKAFLRVWNLRSKQWDWQVADSEDDFYLVDYYHLIVGDKLYVRNPYSLQCFDLMDGSLIWKHNGYTFYFEDNMVTSKNLLISNEIGIKAFSKANGKMMWFNYEAGSPESKITLHDHALYYTYQGEVFSLNANTGRIIWRSNSTENGSNYWFRGNVLVDSTRNSMYVTSGEYLMRVDLPPN